MLFPNDFYVYEHLTNTGEVFYVGKGKKDRAWSTNRNAYWQNIVRLNHGFTVRIVESDLQEWYALELESSLIASHGQRVNGNGTLANLTSGGEGFSHCNETKAKLSLIGKNQFKDHVKRKTHSDAVKIANAKPEYLVKQRLAKLGKKQSADHIEKARQGMRKAKCKPIRCIEEGLTFQTSYEAEKWLRSCGKDRARANKVLAVCQKVRSTAYGYRWKYV